MSMSSLAILWAQYGPYHFARAAALKQQAGSTRVHALELANRSSDYGWNRSGQAVDLITLCPGAVAERLSSREVFHRTRQTFAELKIKTCLLPGYAPKQALAVLLAAKSLGLRTVMMNESHAGTARARGIGMWVKRRLVRWFDSALVGGAPQKRYYASLGLPPEKIFTGYDAVDNDYFIQKSDEIRSRKAEVRNRYGLPEHYFLSLGRFVAKKNLAVLIRAYHRFRLVNPLTETHLVLVGSGEEEPKLRSLCEEFHLPVHNYAALRSSPSGVRPRAYDLHNPGVHFYGFRQVEENPAFYALADAFILPSLWEEWGLVANEAMASGLPVVVSETAGCAEDLLEPCESLEDFPPPTAVQLAKTGLSAKVRTNGFVFNPRSYEELSQVMLVLGTLPGLRSVMGQASRRIIGKFSCEKFALNALRAIEAAVTETVSRAGNGPPPIRFHGSEGSEAECSRRVSLR
jgi:glycosyltransferase involved in cell wall biosynthesis